MASPGTRIVLGHLYGDLLNLYADRGNIITWARRCAWRGLTLEVRQIGIGEALRPDELDLIFMGGGQDGDQRLMADDLFTRKADALRGALAAGLPMLVVCGGYQLFGHYYQPAEGPRLSGLGLFDLHTVHPGPKVPRCIGNVVVDWDPAAHSGADAAGAVPRTLVGFENHGGRTYLGSGARALGRVLSGHGNNAQDGTEGAVVHNAFGTYLHGSLLPKNPHFADHLLLLALRRRRPAATLPPLDDSLEWRAHQAILARYGPKRTSYIKSEAGRAAGFDVAPA
jgi:CobQ-like glutamine amidotransferase family enzyme